MLPLSGALTPLNGPIWGLAAAAAGGAHRHLLRALSSSAAPRGGGSAKPAAAATTPPESAGADGDDLKSRSQRFAERAAEAAAATAAKGAAPHLTVTVNGRKVTVPRGATVLDATNAANVAVPTLCKLPGRSTPGSCRVCMVEVNGVHRAACCTPAVDSAFVTTDTPEVREYVKGLLSLMRSNHPEDCMTCDANGRCEFQTLISAYRAPLLPKVRALSPDFREAASHYSAHDESSPAIALDREKCIKCGRCVEVCQDVQKMNVLGWFARGRERHIGFMCDSDMTASACISCGQCVSVCPVGALSEATHWRTVMDLLGSKRKVMVVQTAPAVRVAIGEELGLPPGAVTTGQMVAALRALGFDHVFDTDFSADLTILEEGTELLGRIKAAGGAEDRTVKGMGAKHAAPPLPMFTSCCPGWINLVEQEYPEFIPHLSSCKSPQQMLGAVVKEVWAPKVGLKPDEVVVVSIMPCTAKKGEAARPEMATAGASPHVDYVLTTRELGRLLRLKRIPAGSLAPEEYDNPMGVSTGAAVLFGNSGGVTEAAVRTVYEVATGQPLPRMEFEAVRGLQGVKQATITLPPPAPADGAAPAADAGQGQDLRIAVVSGIGNARKLLNAMRDGTAPPLDFVEVMTCIGGCIGGGGQPKSRDPSILTKRMQAVYSIDDAAPLRKSHDNPGVQELYTSSLGAPNSHEAHKLLHTKYTPRPKLG